MTIMHVNTLFCLFVVSWTMLRAEADDSSQTAFRFSPIDAVRATGAYLALGDEEKLTVQRRLTEMAREWSSLAEPSNFELLKQTTSPRYAVMAADDSLEADNVSTTAATSAVTTTTALPPSKCEEDVAHVIEGLIESQPWAVDMIDAMGKPVPDIKGGRTFWIGDYDECVAITANYSNIANYSGEKASFKGRYCTAIMPLQATDLHPPIPGAPSTGIRVGLCVPDTCSAQEVTDLLNAVFQRANLSLYAGLTTCQEASIDYDAKAIVSLFLCSIFLLLLLLGTAYDIVIVQWPRWREAEEKTKDTLTTSNNYTAVSDGNPTIVNVTQNGENQPLLEKRRNDPSQPSPGKLGKFLLAFSIYSNSLKILSTTHAPGSLTCVHGIRFASMTWVVLGHTFAFGLTTSANYMTYMANSMKQWTFQAIIGAPVTVDTFFVLSGLLVTYLILKEMERRNGRVQWFLFYFHRFWRLTPPYMLVIMVYVPLFRYLTSGPLWPQTGIEANDCRNSWWTNLLYINNFVHTREMCLTWSWYLSNDMQFYIISPLIFVPLYHFRRLGLLVAFLFLLATVTTAGVIARVNSFPPSMGVSEVDTTVSANYFFDLYIKPYCRFGPYVVGMLTGYLLFITKCSVRIPLLLNLAGWAVATAMGLAVVYGLYDASNGHPLSADASAAYNALNHTVWGLSVCWVIFACATGNGGPVNSLLSWRALIPLSRLTYMAYLVHPIIMELVYLGSPSLFYMSHLNCAMAFLSFTVAAFGVAFILSLAFEAPMMGLEKLIFPTHRDK